MHFKHIYTQDTLSKEYLFVREKSIIISLVIHHCFKQKKKNFLQSCIFFIYVSPKIELLSLNYLYGISVLAFWLHSAQHFLLLLKTLSVTVYCTPIRVVFLVHAAQLFVHFDQRIKGAEIIINMTQMKKKPDFSQSDLPIEIKQPLCQINVNFIFQRQF